jgi:hypothetical protein
MKKTSSASDEFKSPKDEYLESLRAIIKQSQQEKWDRESTRMAIEALWFSMAMKYQGLKFMGVINDI